MKKEFRLLLLVLFLQVSGQQLSAQTFAGNDGALRFFELRDNEGTLIKTANEMGVVGSPMLQEGWGSGTIRFQNGLVFADSLLNFSLYNNKLYLQRNNRYLELVQPAASFSLIFRDENNLPVIHHFRNGFPAVNDHDTTSMYEVLHEGENLQLLLWQHKKVIDVFNYGSSHEKQYTLVQQVYVYQPKEKKMTAINASNIQSIKKSFPEGYANNIEAYCSLHKFNPKHKEQMVDLLAYLDKKH